MLSSWNETSHFADGFHFLEQRVGVGLYWFDIATQKMNWSDGVYDVLNVVRGKVMPSRGAIRELIHPEDRRPLDEMDRLYTSGHPFHIEYRIIMRDRRIRWISNHGEFLMDADGKPKTVMGILRDVNADHVAADMIEDYRRRFNTLLKLRTATAWTASPDGMLTSIHDWKSAFGCDEEPLGLKMLEIMHPDDREQAHADWAAAIANAENYRSEHRILDADRNYRWYRCTALPIKSSNGKVREWLGITVDIDAEKTGGSIKKKDAAATGAQIRGGRSIVRLSVKDLSDLSGVPVGTIRRIEETDGAAKDDGRVLSILRERLEERGVVFLFPVGVKPAVAPA